MNLGKSSTTQDLSSDILCAYQLRVDSPYDVSSVEIINHFLKTYDVEKYFISHEIGEKTKKLHYQGIIFVKKELKDNCRNKIRYYFKTRIPSKNKQPVSITAARDPIGMIAYVCKSVSLSAWLTDHLSCTWPNCPPPIGQTGHSVITNYSYEEIKCIPEWNDTTKQYNFAIAKILKDLTPDNKEFCKKIIRCYIRYEKSPPTKQMLYKYLLKSKRMSTSQYLIEIGMFGEWACYHEPDPESDGEASS